MVDVVSSVYYGHYDNCYTLHTQAIYCHKVKRKYCTQEVP